MEHMTLSQLEAGLNELRNSPQDAGILKLIVRRPNVGVREVLESAELHLADGLVGDNWKTRGNSQTSDGASDPEKQLNIMNSRAIALVAQHPDRWPLAGDQLYIDLNLGPANLPPGTHLQIGSAVIQVTSPPHTGCSKFMARFGRDATLFVNSPGGRELNLRGINALPALRVYHRGLTAAHQLVQCGRLARRVGQQAAVVVGDQALHGLRRTRLVGADEPGDQIGSS